MWPKAEGFKNLINGWWHNIEVRGTGNYVLTEKLKVLKGNLRIWNKEAFRKVEERKKSALEKVAFGMLLKHKDSWRWMK